MDHCRVRGIRFDLLPESQDVDVHRAVRKRAIITPDRVEQLLPTEYHTRAGHQKLQQFEFSGSEREYLAVALDAATSAVDLNSGRSQGRLGRRSALAVHPKLQFDACNQLSHEERLHDVI